MKKKGYIVNIEDASQENHDYRRVLYTGKNLQLVLMDLKPGEEIGEETHDDVDQFIRVEQGHGKVVLNKTEEHDLYEEFAVIIPAGTVHNVVNIGVEDLKLYTIYSPPEHKDGTVHLTRVDEKEEHFDGVTTE